MAMVQHKISHLQYLVLDLCQVKWLQGRQNEKNVHDGSSRAISEFDTLMTKFSLHQG